MAKPKVRTRIEVLMQPVIERAQLSREEWLETLVRIIRADIRRMFDLYGRPLPFSDLGPNEAAAIAALEVYGRADNSDPPEERGGRPKVRIVDKLKALELYGKAMGYFAEPLIAGPSGVLPSITVEFVDPPKRPLHPDGECTNALAPQPM
jgi:hypothetical protein